MTPPRTGEYRSCDACGGEFYWRPSDDRRGYRRRFCSRKCQNSTYFGEGNPKWRGGKVISSSGYVHILLPDHPQADRHGYYEEHRHVVEQSIGRILDPTECVHHINHVKTDNRIENLQLMESWAEHRRQHAYYEPAECSECGAVMERSITHRRRWDRAFCSRKCAAAAASRTAAETGSNYGNAKLTADQARAIRERRASGEQAIRLAEEYGVSTDTVGRIARGKAWVNA